MDTGISTLVDLNVPFEELARMIAGAGFTHLSLSHDVVHSSYHLPSERGRIAGLLDELSLKLNYIHSPIQYFYDLTSLDDQVQRASIEVIKMSAKACDELGGQYVVIHVMNGPRAADEDIDLRVAAGIEALSELKDYAAERDVQICLENLPLDHDYGIVSQELIKATAGWDDLPVCLDSCHAWLGNDDPLDLVRSMAARVKVLHLSDTMGEHDSHLIPGDGNVDFMQIGRELGCAGFSGVVDLECSLWMLERRRGEGRAHSGDPVPCSTEHYLERAAAAAERIAGWIDDGRQTS